jgi:hypothetical protein
MINFNFLSRKFDCKESFIKIYNSQVLEIFLGKNESRGERSSGKGLLDT